MPRTSPITPTKMAKLRELRAAGVGLREAAKAIGVSHMTVSRWEERTGNTTPRASKARRATPEAAAAADVVSRPLPSPSDPEALTEARARRDLVRGLLQRLTPAVEAGEYPPTNYVVLARYGDDVDRLIAELTPPAPKNPADDPDVHESARLFLSRIETMIADAEQPMATAKPKSRKRRLDGAEPES